MECRGHRKPGSPRRGRAFGIQALCSLSPLRRRAEPQAAALLRIPRRSTRTDPPQTGQQR